MHLSLRHFGADRFQHSLRFRNFCLFLSSSNCSLHNCSIKHISIFFSYASLHILHQCSKNSSCLLTVPEQHTLILCLSSNIPGKKSSVKKYVLHNPKQNNMAQIQDFHNLNCQSLLQLSNTCNKQQM